MVAFLLNFQILSLFVVFISVASENIPQIEFDALQSLYSSTNGELWTYNNFQTSSNSQNNVIPWNFTGGIENQNPCEFHWAGLSCSSSCYSSNSSSNNNNNNNNNNNADSTQSCFILHMNLTSFGLFGNFPTNGLFSNFINLNSLVLASNKLSGTLETNFLTSLTSLSILNIANNQLFGFLPFSSNVSNNLNNVNLTVIDLSFNSFSSTIPSGIENFINLKSINFRHNKLTGSIPSNIGNLKNLEQLDFSYNQLTNSLPDSLLSLKNLKVLLLSNNKLSSFELNFDYKNYSNTNISSILSSIEIIDISDNALSGNIYPNLFNLHSLKFLFLQNNCFEGSIPSSICNSKNLKYLSMNGLSSGTSCRRNFINSYLIKFMTGSIPKCLFELPYIESINLAGNGFHGYLPNSDISKNLKNVNLAYNRLGGSIPSNFQAFPFETFDISYNKITGTCEHLKMNLDGNNNLYNNISNFTTNLNLEVNRLSGGLSNYFHDAENINIINGNLFNCLSQDELPKKDPGTPNAVCGTQVTDISFYGTLIFLSLGWALFMWYTFSGYFERLKRNSQKNEIQNQGVIDNSKNQIINSQSSFDEENGETKDNCIIQNRSFPKVSEAFERKSHESDLNNINNKERDLSVSLVSRKTNASMSSFGFNDFDETLRIKRISQQEEEFLELEKNQENNEINSLLDNDEKEKLKLSKTIKVLVGEEKYKRESQYSREDIFEYSDLYTTHSFHHKNINSKNLENQNNENNENLSNHDFKMAKKSESENKMAKSDFNLPLIQRLLQYLFDNNDDNEYIKTLKNHLITKSLFQWVKITSYIMHSKPEELVETTRFLRLLVEIRNTFWIITIYILIITLPTYLSFRFSENGKYNTHKYVYGFSPSLVGFIGRDPTIAFFFVLFGLTLILLYNTTSIQRKETKHKKKMERKMRKLRNLNIKKQENNNNNKNEYNINQIDSSVFNPILNKSNLISNNNDTNNYNSNNSLNNSDISSGNFQTNNSSFSLLPPSSLSNLNNSNSNSSSNSLVNTPKSILKQPIRTKDFYNKNDKEEIKEEIDYDFDMSGSHSSLNSLYNEQDYYNSSSNLNSLNSLNSDFVIQQLEKDENNGNKNNGIVNSKIIIKTNTNDDDEENYDHSKSWFRFIPKIILYVVIPLINLVVILSINVLYLYVIFNQKRVYKLLMTTFISTFKMIWNMLIVPALMQSVKGSGPMFVRKLIMQMLIMIFNIVLAPVVVNAMASPDCLLHLLFPPAEIVISSTITVCDKYDRITGNCVNEITNLMTKSYDPPYIYGYQCSTSSILNYTPAYVQMYAIVAVVMPSVAVFMFTFLELNTDDEALKSSYFTCCFIKLALFLKNLKTIPPIYKFAKLLGHYHHGMQKSESPAVSKKGFHDSNSNANFYDSANDLNNVNSNANVNVGGVDSDITQGDRKTLLADYHNSRILKKKENAPTQTILNPDTIFSHLMGHLMVLVCFGLAYPPLAVLISITVSIVTFQWQILVGRYLSQISTKPEKELHLLKVQIEVGCYGISRRFFKKTKWFIIVLMSLFFILFAFDMNADQVNNNFSKNQDNDQSNKNEWLWAVLIFSFYSIPIYILFQIYQNFYDLKDLLFSLVYFLSNLFISFFCYCCYGNNNVNNNERNDDTNIADSKYYFQKSYNNLCKNWTKFFSFKNNENKEQENKFDGHFSENTLLD